MEATALLESAEAVHALIQDYLDVLRGTDESAILACNPDNMELHLPTGTLDGKIAVRDNFVRPFLTEFLGNVHSIQHLAYTENLAAVEWNFDAVHKGLFGTIIPSGNKVHIPGCSWYQFDLETRQILGGAPISLPYCGRLARYIVGDENQS